MVGTNLPRFALVTAPQDRPEGLFFSAANSIG